VVVDDKGLGLSAVGVRGRALLVDCDRFGNEEVEEEEEEWR